MTEKTSHRVLRLAAIVIAASLIVYYGVVFTGQLPDHRLIRRWNDVVMHAGAFGFLSVALLASVPLVPAAAAMSALAIAIEAVQMLLPERTASLRDLGASLAGIPLGWLIVAGGRAVADRRARPRQGVTASPPASEVNARS